jgi:hypothetical protein
MATILKKEVRLLTFFASENVKQLFKVYSTCRRAFSLLKSKSSPFPDSTGPNKLVSEFYVKTKTKIIITTKQKK